MNFKSYVTKMCAPAQVYLAVAAFSCVLYVYSMLEANEKMVEVGGKHLHRYTVLGLVFKVTFSVFWAIFLNYVCKTFKHGQSISWIILLLPLLFFGFAMVMMLYTVSQMALSTELVHQKQTETN